MTLPVDDFSIAVPDAVLADLSRRLEQTLWTDSVDGADWERGTSLDYLKSLVGYWRDGFDWRAREAELNQWPNRMARIDGCELHYIHLPGQGVRRTPILLLHGWPSSHIQMFDLARLLVQPDEDGHAFDVVIASLPGYGLSSISAEPGWGCRRMAAVLVRLMRDVLGYDRWVVRAGDIGAAVADRIAADHPHAVMGLHLTGMLEPDHAAPPPGAAAAERAFLDASNVMWQTEMAYARMHMTRPQTLALGLTDSPVGLAAWVLEKFRIWSDCDGDLDKRFSRDDLLTNLMLYWTTRSIHSAIRVYYELIREPPLAKPLATPTAMLVNRKDMFPAVPREWAERTYNIVQWRQTDVGGHFLEWEEPQIVFEDLRAFARHPAVNKEEHS